MTRTILYAVATGLSAALLFVIEPLAAKRFLPLLGGSPSVWTTCQLFFQAALTAGYLLAHGAIRLGPRAAAAGQTLLFAVVGGLLILGGSIADETPTGAPTIWLLTWLTRDVGPAFLALSMTAPALQALYVAGRSASAAQMDRDQSGDPYWLYAASNAGALAGLLAYPFVIEPILALDDQRRFWRLGWMICGVLVAACVAESLWSHRSVDVTISTRDCSRRVAIAPRVWLKWAALAAAPSSLMLGLTTLVTTDVASTPLFWVVPLAIYLLTMIAAFAHRVVVPRGWAGRVSPWFLATLTPALGFGMTQWYWLPLHLAAFAAAALACHERLSASRPDPGGLASFYVAIAIGGAAGGVFNSLVAPAVFDRIAEYPAALVCCVVLASGARPRGSDFILPGVVLALGGVSALWPELADSPLGYAALAGGCGVLALQLKTLRRRPIRAALGLAAGMAACGLWPGVGGRVILRGRDFFGVVRVSDSERAGPAGVVRTRLFFSGGTLHGTQSLDPSLRGDPLTYYRRAGPVGQVVELALPRRGDETRVAVVGLGAGTLASYARPDEHWSFFEIDPSVSAIALNPALFTYMSDALARGVDLSVIHGDARLSLRSCATATFGLIVLDAFTSDAVPTHLLTREAFAEYRRVLRPGGVAVFNITNRYLDLVPVVAALASDADWTSRAWFDLDLSLEERLDGKQPSIWAVVVADPEDLGTLARDPRLLRTTPSPHDLWSDGSSNLAGHLTARSPRSRLEVLRADAK